MALDTTALATVVSVLAQTTIFQSSELPVVLAMAEFFAAYLLDSFFGSLFYGELERTMLGSHLRQLVKEGAIGQGVHGSLPRVPTQGIV